MLENRKRIQNLLENVIRASELFIQKGYLDVEEGKTRIRVLMGIRQRFLSDEYMKKTPQGYDIDEIDEMVLPLDRMLVDAGKRGYQNTISYILKAVIQGTGVGHRVLTEEEDKNRAIVLLQRKLKMQDAIDAVEKAWKLDEKISSRKFIVKRQEMLRKDCKTYETKIEQVKQERPDIMEDILYFADLEDVSSDVLEYLELMSALEHVKKSILKNEDDLENLDYLISSYMQILEHAKRWDIQPNVQTIGNAKSKALQDNPTISKTSSATVSLGADTEISGHNESAEKTLEPHTSVEKGDQEELEADLISDEKMQEMQKIIEKFVDEDGPDMIDLGYEAMERVFTSPELKSYVSKSLQEFEELGFSEELGLDE